jgi:hypothetical protein
MHCIDTETCQNGKYFANPPSLPWLPVFASLGGKARAKKLSQERRSEIARQGGNAKAARHKEDQFETDLEPERRSCSSFLWSILAHAPKKANNGIVPSRRDLTLSFERIETRRGNLPNWQITSYQYKLNFCLRADLQRCIFRNYTRLFGSPVSFHSPLCLLT